MKLSEDGAKKLMDREGWRNYAYQDTKKIWTIGVGHTGPGVVSGLYWSQEQVLEAFQEDVKWAEAEVNLVIVPLSQNQFDALVSFVFNVGAGAFRKSTLKKMLNSGDFLGAAEQFDRWHIPPEIIGRRNSEKKQFMS